MPGLNEGLAILEALISRQWPGLWPQPVHAREVVFFGFTLSAAVVRRQLLQVASPDCRLFRLA